MGLNPRYWEWGRKSEGDSTRAIVYPTVPSDYNWPFGPTFSMGSTRTEEYASTFAGYIQAAYQSNGPVFACSLARMWLFSEARFQWRQFRSGRPGQLFGTEDLNVLERPWPNGYTGDLLTRMEQDVTGGGNFYARRSGDTLQRMRPDWTVIVIGSNMDVDDPAAALDAEIAGYVYYPGGKGSGADPIAIPVEEVVHYAPIPDPLARFRGMSWLTPIFREIYSDSAATTHKLKFFEGGATPNLAISVDLPDPDDFFEFVRRYREEGEGVANAYKTLFFNAGTTFQTVGTDLKQLDFKVVQGAGESRIASAAGVPPVIVGFSEGLEAATYSNYQLAMRRFADLTMRPLWRMAAASLSSVLEVPGGAELWYDDRDIAALKDDIEKRAAVQTSQATAYKLAIDAGATPDSVRDWLDTDDITQLEHSGLTSVQLQPMTPEDQAAVNGNGEQPALPPAEQDRAVLRELQNALEKGR